MVNRHPRYGTLALPLVSLLVDVLLQRGISFGVLLSLLFSQGGLFLPDTEAALLAEARRWKDKLQDGECAKALFGLVWGQLGYIRGFAYEVDKRYHEDVGLTLSFLERLVEARLESLVFPKDEKEEEQVRRGLEHSWVLMMNLASKGLSVRGLGPFLRFAPPKDLAAALGFVFRDIHLRHLKALACEGPTEEVRILASRYYWKKRRDRLNKLFRGRGILIRDTSGRYLDPDPVEFLCSISDYLGGLVHLKRIGKGLYLVWGSAKRKDEDGREGKEQVFLADTEYYLGLKNEELNLEDVGEILAFRFGFPGFLGKAILTLPPDRVKEVLELLERYDYSSLVERLADFPDIRDSFMDYFLARRIENL